MEKRKLVAITGATSGIGKATAIHLAKQGYKVVATGRNEQKLLDLAMKHNITYMAGDITDPELPGQLLHLCLKIHGRCDAFVNNAGMIETGTVEDIDIEAVCEMMRVNVEAAFRAMYVFAKYFQKENRGDLINISSVLGTKVRETAGAYAASKYAVEALSESLRMEFAHSDVRVTCIEPGLVKTDLHRHWEAHPSEKMGIPHPLQPEDVAETVAYVLSQKPHVRIPKLMILPKDHKI